MYLRKNKRLLSISGSVIFYYLSNPNLKVNQHFITINSVFTVVYIIKYVHVLH